jgi:hypothetical protein
MQIGVKDLPGSQHGALRRLRFLDLDDHVGTFEDGFGAVHDFSPGFAVLLVGQADGFAAVTLDHDLMAVGD